MSSLAGPARDPGVDAARGLAVLSMYVAHVAPEGGATRVPVLLADFLTAPLFALLVGVGAELGRGRTGLGTVAFRGAVLVALGIWLSSLPSQILIVLVWLGVLTWLMAGVVRLPTPAIAAFGVGLLVAFPWARRATQLWIGDHYLDLQGDAGGALTWTLDFLLTGYAYHLVRFAGLACLGVLVVRLGLLRRSGRSLVLGAGALAGCVGLVLVDVAGGPPLVPYAGTRAETAFVVAAALAVVLLVGPLARAAGAAAAPLAAVGAMTLTLYAGHVLVTVGYLATGPTSGTDDSWPLLAALVAGSVALAVGWRSLVPDGPWHRGPLEGLVTVLGGPVAQAQSLRSRT